MGQRVTLPLLKVFSELMHDLGAQHYGFEICKASGLASGTVYPILARMEEEGMLTSAWETIDPIAEGRRPRRYYRLTGEGQAQARQVLLEAADLVSVAGRSRSPSVLPRLRGAVT
jgi:PadR family transcriptional regulator PadR